MAAPGPPEADGVLPGRRVVVAGYGVTGRAVTEVLTARASLRAT